MVIPESVKSAHTSVSNVLSSISVYANDSFKEIHVRNAKLSFLSLQGYHDETQCTNSYSKITKCGVSSDTPHFVELENQECMKVVMEKLQNFSPHT